MSRSPPCLMSGLAREGTTRAPWGPVLRTSQRVSTLTSRRGREAGEPGAVTLHRAGRSCAKRLLPSRGTRKDTASSGAASPPRRAQAPPPGPGVAPRASRPFGSPDGPGGCGRAWNHPCNSSGLFPGGRSRGTSPGSAPCRPVPPRTPGPAALWAAPASRTVGSKAARIRGRRPAVAGPPARPLRVDARPPQPPAPQPHPAPPPPKPLSTSAGDAIGPGGGGAQLQDSASLESGEAGRWTQPPGWPPGCPDHCLRGRSRGTQAPPAGLRSWAGPAEQSGTEAPPGQESPRDGSLGPRAGGGRGRGWPEVQRKEAEVGEGLKKRRSISGGRSWEWGTADPH